MSPSALSPSRSRVAGAAW